jgi:hypothetical protein
MFPKVVDASTSSNDDAGCGEQVASHKETTSAGRVVETNFCCC